MHFNDVVVNDPPKFDPTCERPGLYAVGNDVYILAQTAVGVKLFISLREGNRWSDRSYNEGDPLPQGFIPIKSATITRNAPKHPCDRSY